VSTVPLAGPRWDTDTAAPPRLLTIEEVRTELNIGRTLAYQLVTSGALAVVRVGHVLRVRRADLDAYLEANLGRGRISTVG
jgi:excisionase family DNA binding protein